MIGLLDVDILLSTSIKKLIPNIEIMKLANYYRKEENHFSRLMSLDEQELTVYDKIYVFSELHPNFKIPEQFLRAPNVIYGGSAFTKDYIPFENKLIDYTFPHPFIYKDFLKEKYSNGIKTKVISNVLDYTYYRIYAGDTKLPMPVIMPGKQVIIYDKEFFYPDWEETIQKISDKKPSSIQRIHPIVCHTLTQYFEVRAHPKIGRTNEIILDIDVPLDEVPYMFNKYRNKFLGDIVQTSNVYLGCGGSWPTQIQYFRDFIYKVNLLYCFWGEGVPIKIKFLEPDVGYTNPLYDLEKNLELFSRPRWKKTLDEKILLKTKKTPSQEQKELLLTHFPKAKPLFSQSFDSIRKQGRWRV